MQNKILELQELLIRKEQECGKLKAENKELKHENRNLKLQLEPYNLPPVVKVLTDWHTGKLQIIENQRNKYKQALEEIEKSIRNVCKEECGYAKILDIIAKAKGEE